MSESGSTLGPPSRPVGVKSRQRNRIRNHQPMKAPGISHRFPLTGTTIAAISTRRTKRKRCSSAIRATRTASMPIATESLASRSPDFGTAGQYFPRPFCGSAQSVGEYPHSRFGTIAQHGDGDARNQPVNRCSSSGFFLDQYSWRPPRKWLVLYSRPRPSLTHPSRYLLVRSEHRLRSSGSESISNNGDSRHYVGNKSVDRNGEYPYPLSTVLLGESVDGGICFVVPGSEHHPLTQLRVAFGERVDMGYSEASP